MTNFLPFLVYVLVTTFTPGPNNILSMTNAVRLGYRKTLPFLAGICLGFALVMLLAGLLNVALASWLPMMKPWLNFLGIVYLLYLAIHIVRSKPVEDNPTGTNLNTFKAGFTLQFVNVKGILYGVTVFSIFIVDTYRDLVSIVLFSILLSVVAFSAVSLWAFAGNVFRNYLKKHYRLFNWTMAGLLVYTAVASLIPHQ